MEYFPAVESQGSDLLDNYDAMGGYLTKHVLYQPI